MTATASHLSLPVNPVVRVLTAIRPGVRNSATALQADDTARRDFVLEMLRDNPEAFQCEADVQHMAFYYSGRF